MNAALLLLSLIVQDDAARAAKLLEETAAKLKAAPAIAFERTSIQLSENSKEPYGQTTSLIILRRPNQARWDSTGKSWDTLTVLDGTHLWQLDRKKNEYRKHAQKPNQVQYWLHDGPLNALFFEMAPAKVMEGARDVRIRSEKDGDVACDVITWKAKIPSEGAESGDLTLWIGPDRLPRRYIKQYERRDTIYTHTTEYGKLDLNPKVTDETFAFTPPADAKVADPNDYRRQRIPTSEEAKKAQKILEAVQEAFRSAETLSYEVTADSGNAYVRRSTSTLKRPNLLRMTTVTAGIDATSVMICDGTDVWHVDESERTYRKYDMSAGPTQSLGSTDPLACLFLEPGAPLILSESMTVTVATEELDGAPCDVIGWKMRGQSLKLWIGADRHPRKLVTEWSGQGRSGSITSTYARIAAAPTTDAAQFTFKPVADWRDLTNARPGEKHLAAGAVAPDFEMLDRGGAAMKLSELRGKPVVLVFGRYLYPGEADRAQEFHDSFGPRGAVVVAVAHGKRSPSYDPKKHTFRLARPKDPGVVAAYGADVFGGLYLIDGEGKVVIATIANEELKAAMAKLIGPAAAPAGPAPAAGGEKEARETIRKAAEALRKADALAYPVTWHLKESVGFTRFECRAQVRRPNLRRLEGSFRSDYGRDDPCIIVLDGKEEWTFSPGEKELTYSKRPQPLKFSSSLYDDTLTLLFFEEPFTSWMELATDIRQVSEDFDGKPCSMIEWGIRFTSDVKWRLWIDEAFAVRRIEKKVGGQLFMAIDFGKIEVNPKTDDKTFRLDLPAGAKERNWRHEYESKLIAEGAEAPDFEAKDLDGKTVKLSGWRGKPVLFIAWSFP